MNKDQLINEAIDSLVEETPGSIGEAQQVVGQLAEAEQAVKDLQIRLSHLVEQINSCLAMEVRKAQPKIDVGLNNAQCSCRYRSRMITIRPDLNEGVWEISGSPFARRFARIYPHLTKIGEDVTPLAHAIADYFSNRYRSLAVR